MQGTSPIAKLKTFFDTDRGVSPVIAVALLILIAIGFVVAIQGAGAQIIDSIEQPPEAYIDGNLQSESVILTVMSVQNADQLEIQIDGDRVEDSDDEKLRGDINEWRDSPRAGLTAEIEVDDGVQLQVVATNLPDNDRVVYSYSVPN